MAIHCRINSFLKCIWCNVFIILQSLFGIFLQDNVTLSSQTQLQNSKVNLAILKPILRRVCIKLHGQYSYKNNFCKELFLPFPSNKADICLVIFLQDSSSSWFQIHWNNPKRIGGMVDASGMTIYYNPNLRQNDAGIMVVGQFWINLPPKRKGWKSTLNARQNVQQSW